MVRYLRIGMNKSSYIETNGKVLFIFVARLLNIRHFFTGIRIYIIYLTDTDLLRTPAT